MAGVTTGLGPHLAGQEVAPGDFSGAPSPHCQSESTGKDSLSPSWEEGWRCPRTATRCCGFTCRSSFKELTCPGPSQPDLVWVFIRIQKSPLGQVQM